MHLVMVLLNLTNVVKLVNVADPRWPVAAAIVKPVAADNMANVANVVAGALAVVDDSDAGEMMLQEIFR